MGLNSFDELMNRLEVAYRDNNVAEINRINSLIMDGLDITVNESALDYEFIESIRGKAVFKTLTKLLKEDTMSKHEVLKLVSSLVTHLVIESEVKRKEIKNYPVKLLMDVFNKLVVDEGKIDDAKRFIRDKYGRFI